MISADHRTCHLGYARPINVVLTRESVCMSDDVDAPHERWFTDVEGLDLRDALQIISARYLPRVSGGNVFWRVDQASFMLGCIRHQPEGGFTVSDVPPGAKLRGDALHFTYVPARDKP